MSMIAWDSAKTSSAPQRPSLPFRSLRRSRRRVSLGMQRRQRSLRWPCRSGVWLSKKSRPLVAQITLERPASGSGARQFRVFVGAPAEATNLGTDSPFYAGTVVFFGPPMAGVQMAHEATFTVPLPAKLPTLTTPSLQPRGKRIWTFRSCRSPARKRQRRCSRRSLSDRFSRCASRRSSLRWSPPPHMPWRGRDWKERSRFRARCMPAPMCGSRCKSGRSRPVSAFA
jgi:hypothetical protein